MANKWTERDNQILIDEVAETPENVRSALRRTSIKLNRTFYGVQAHYYNLIRNNPEKMATCYMMVAREKLYKNRKKVAQFDSNPVMPNKKSLWQKIRALLHI